MILINDLRNDYLVQHGLLEDRPTPLALYHLFQTASINITYQNGTTFNDYLPYGYTDPSQFTSRDEGPKGWLCHPWSHNRTDSDPPPPVVKKVRKIKTVPAPKQTKQQGWHERMWSEVIEKSHAPSHPLLGGKQWAGEVTKVALVVFVKADCRSCTNSLETLAKVHKDLHMQGERGSCVPHITSGDTPTSQPSGGRAGWVLPLCVPQQCHLPYTRTDYHGVIQEKEIMKWFGKIAESSIQNLMFEKPAKTMIEDVRLVGTLIPRYSRFLPRPPGTRTHEYYFSYQCFRLVCERLFGRAVCYSVYSSEIPAREYNDPHLELIVTKVYMERRDGAGAVITQLGKSLPSLLENRRDLPFTGSTPNTGTSWVLIRSVRMTMVCVQTSSLPSLRTTPVSLSPTSPPTPSTQKSEDRDVEGMYSFPRVCIVSRHNHRRAIFYPPLHKNDSPQSGSAGKTSQSTGKFLVNPEKYMAQTEHF
uniref:Uncharacterized protein LOC111120303 n=1 Tax=Crassostrea virginica TaxID=6565 RepID=A0A8B8CLU2_CRAVI|nr:uncharacterized protein LOC111120303 [Crassostrea virginica]